MFTFLLFIIDAITKRTVYGNYGKNRYASMPVIYVSSVALYTICTNNKLMSEVRAIGKQAQLHPFANDFVIRQ